MILRYGTIALFRYASLNNRTHHPIVLLPLRNHQPQIALEVESIDRSIDSVSETCSGSRFQSFFVTPSRYASDRDAHCPWGNFTRVKNSSAGRPDLIHEIFATCTCTISEASIELRRTAAGPQRGAFFFLILGEGFHCQSCDQEFSRRDVYDKHVQKGDVCRDAGAAMVYGTERRVIDTHQALQPGGAVCYAE